MSWNFNLTPEQIKELTSVPFDRAWYMCEWPTKAIEELKRKEVVR